MFRSADNGKIVVRRKSENAPCFFPAANSFSIESTIPFAAVAEPNRRLSAADSAGSIPRLVHSVSIERIEIHADQHGVVLLSKTVGVDSVGGPSSTDLFDREKRLTRHFSDGAERRRR